MGWVGDTSLLALIEGDMQKAESCRCNPWTDCCRYVNRTTYFFEFLQQPSTVFNISSIYTGKHSSKQPGILALSFLTLPDDGYTNNRIAKSDPNQQETMQHGSGLPGNHLEESVIPVEPRISSIWDFVLEFNVF